MKGQYCILWYDSSIRKDETTRPDCIGRPCRRARTTRCSRPPVRGSDRSPTLEPAPDASTPRMPASASRRRALGDSIVASHAAADSRTCALSPPRRRAMRSTTSMQSARAGLSRSSAAASYTSSGVNPASSSKASSRRGVRFYSSVGRSGSGWTVRVGRGGRRMRRPYGGFGATCRPGKVRDRSRRVSRFAKHDDQPPPRQYDPSGSNPVPEGPPGPRSRLCRSSLDAPARMLPRCPRCRRAFRTRARADARPSSE